MGGDLRRQWFLGEPKLFHFVNQSGCHKIDGAPSPRALPVYLPPLQNTDTSPDRARASGVDDGEGFATLGKELRGLRLTDATVRRLFRLLAALQLVQTAVCPV